jgi:hypothetical protein
MARIVKLRIANYRSVGKPIEISFPENQPVVLLGENVQGSSSRWQTRIAERTGP